MFQLIALVLFAQVQAGASENRSVNWLIHAEPTDCLVMLDQEYRGEFTRYSGDGLLEKDRHPEKRSVAATHAWIGRDGAGETVRLILSMRNRRSPPTANCPGSFIYVRNLPALSDLMKIKTGSEFYKLFGEPRNLHDSWGGFDIAGNKTIGKTASWCAFTTNEDGTLRIVTVLVIMYGTDNLKITDRAIHEGKLVPAIRQANPEHRVEQSD